MRKFFLFLNLFIISFLFFIFVGTSKASAACDLRTISSPLKVGSINSITYYNITPDIEANGYYYLAFESPTLAGKCPTDYTKTGKDAWACISNRVNTTNKSITFSGATKLGGLKDLKAGTYKVLLLADKLGNGSLVGATCSKNNIAVLTSSGSQPPEDPEGPGQNQTCTITDPDKNQECIKNPIIRYRGTCATGFYCNCSTASWTCQKLICADGSDDCYGTVPEEAEPTKECTVKTQSTDCISGSCVDGKCDNEAPVPFACAQRANGNYSCKTAIGRIDTNPEKFSQSLLRILLGLSGGILLILIIINGYKIMTSQGDPEKIKDAREGIIAAIAGILLIIFSLSILQLITVDIIGIPGFG